MNPHTVNQVVALCHRAGVAILDVYRGQEAVAVTIKPDQSPVTAADLAAHSILESGLTPLIDGVPVLSEEGTADCFTARSHWDRYWLIDPLDGTREFLAGNGEFTVNVALIEKGQPVFGVVYAPVLDTTYVGLKNVGAVKYTKGQQRPIRTRSVTARMAQGFPVKVLSSRAYGDAILPLMDRIGERLGSVDITPMGSSLKLCLVAEGVADIYPRLAPTCEWDTAAAQAVLEAAGGVVVDCDLNPLRYNQKDSLLNPSFYALGDAQFDWPPLLKPVD